MKALKKILQFKYVLIFTLIIILISIIKVNNYKSHININDNEFIFIVTDIKYGEDITLYLKGKDKVIGKVEYLKDISIGDKVYVKGRLKEAKNSTIPNTFNYKKYLRRNNIFYLLDIDEIKLVNKSKNIFYILKNKIINLIEKKSNKNYLYTFLLGNSDFIDEEDYIKFKENGITHLFAVSGMHISFLSGLIFFILSLLRVKEIKKYIITFIILLFFAFLTNFSNSVLRSILFFLILGINKTKRLNMKKETILFLTLSIILIFNPSSLYSYSLIFSFIITFFLIYYSNIEEGYFKLLFKTSFISFISSLPILININYEINIMTILNNIIFVPLVSVFIYPLCIFSMLFSFLDPILSIFINILTYLNSLVNTYKIVLIVPKMNVLFILIYYSILLIYRFIKRKEILIVLFIILILNYFKIQLNTKSYVYYFDVSQADSSLIINKNKIVLIDAGGNYYSDYSIKNIITFLKSMGIRKIDYLILSHGDYDHIGKAQYLINNFKVNKVIFNIDEYNELENELIKVLNKKKIKYYKDLKELNIGSDKLYFLNTKDYNNENDNSNVVYTKLNNYKFLFMADAGIEREKDILEKYNLENIDFIKIGHHGSNTSSSKEFIDTIKPKNCVISVGLNNRYGHPKDNVLNILDDYCDVFRTDLNGSIEIKINRNNYKIKTYSL